MAKQTRRIRLKKDIVIPAGTEIQADGPIKVQYGELPYYHTIGFGPDVTGSLVIPQGDEEYAAEHFEVVDAD